MERFGLQCAGAGRPRSARLPPNRVPQLSLISHISRYFRDGAPAGAGAGCVTTVTAAIGELPNHPLGAFAS